MHGVRRPRRGSVAFTLVVAVSLSAAATAVALLVPHRGLVAATALHLLAVVVAAAVGGLVPGLVTAALSLLSLNFFFTIPKHTLRITEPADVVALVVFLAVSAIVGTVVGRARAERERAERGEAEARLLTDVATSVSTPDGLGGGLRSIAASLVAALALARCEVEATVDGEQLSAVAEAPGSPPPGTVQVVEPIPGSDRPMGRVVAVERSGGPRLGRTERAVVRVVAAQLGMALERAKLDAEVRTATFDAESSRLRAALFASVSHDLRTPLASIKAAISTLLDDQAAATPEVRRELLETVAEETDRLNRLVGRILDAARLRSGSVELDTQVVTVEEVIEGTLGHLDAVLAPFSVRVQVRPDLPLVDVDPVQVDQVLSNLLENAARHAPRGSAIDVSAAAWRNTIVVRVADRGPGIPDAERGRVFEEFRSGDLTRGGRPGLGLAIARAIVEAHGGKIWVEGTPGGGATVAFTLPVAAVRAEELR